VFTSGASLTAAHVNLAVFLLYAYGGVAQWLERRSLTGELSLIHA